MKRKLKELNPFLGFFLMGACLLMLVVNLLVPSRNWSVLENRPLKEAYSLDWKQAASPGFAQEAEAVYADQFFGRTTLMHINYLVRRGLGQTVLNGVYLGQDMLFLVPEEQDAMTAMKSVSSISTFLHQTGLPGTLMVVPSAMNIEENRLPAYVSAAQERDILQQIVQNGAENVTVLDLEPVLQEVADEYIYYRTDHHWTTRGAGYGARALIQSAGMEFAADDFKMLQVSDSFQGTLASKTGSVGLQDDIFIAPSASQPEYVVTWADGTRTASIYNTKALEQKDQYELFLGKNQSVIHIETAGDSERSLLLFKDSYANSMIQYLLPYYGSITIVDPRYYADDLNSLTATYGITECAFVYSYDTFVSGGQLSSLLDGAVEASMALRSEEGTQQTENAEG